LGIKQLQPDVWEQFFTSHRPGDTVRGRVVRHAPFGVFVELDEGIEGLIHVSEFDDSHGGEKIDLQVGHSYQMKIIKLSPQERKIGLSIRAMKNDEYRADWEAYQDGEGTGTATLGDHFRNR
jgi:small subunit ribosomal protein S1